MEFKKIFVLFAILLAVSGTAMAIRGAGVTKLVSLDRWTAVGTAGSDVTEGGNITILNLTVNSLTDRWAGYYGNLTGALYLTDNISGTTQYLYRWAGAPATDDGEVCASTASAYNFLLAEVTTAAEVDTAWAFGAVADNAAATFLGATCTLVFDEQPRTVTNTIYADHVNSTFNTCAIDNGVAAAETDFAFCVNTSASGTSYNGQSVNYELMVPVTYGATETYYFYAELN